MRDGRKQRKQEQKRIKRREKEDGISEKRKEKLNIYLKHHRRTCKSKLTFDYL